jgi:hypothetical protein
MLDLLQFILTLFTNPVEAIGVIVIIGLIVGGLRWFANRSKSNVPLDAVPEVILRHLLKFVDEDLEQNRSATFSPKQIKRMRKEFLIVLIAYIALIVLFGFIVVTMSWEDMFRWGFDLIAIGLLSCMGLVFLFVIGIAVFHLWGYIRDLRTKRAVALFSPIVFEEHEGEYMGFKFKTHQYKILINDARLPEPLSLSIGFMSEEVWYQVQKLSYQSAILYIAPNTSKLLSFELVATEPAISQKDVR